MTGFSNFVLSFFLLLSVTPTVIAKEFPIVGPNRFDVAITTASLTDPGRIDPFAKDKSARRMAISIYNPVTNCRKKSLQAYMPPATAAFEDAKFGAYGLPNGSFPALELRTCTSTTKSSIRSSKQDFPLVLFSGALATSRFIYSSMLQSVAAAGYLVVSIDHPYDTDIVELSDGTVIEGVNIDDDELDAALATRVDDIAYVHLQLQNQSFVNTNVPSYGQGCSSLSKKVATLGHSFGGAAAAGAMLQNPVIGGGINLDGSMFGPVLQSGLNRPFMLMGHDNKTQENDPSWKTVWPKLTGWKREFEVKKTAHYSFSDLPLVMDVLGLQGHLPEEVSQLLGSIEGRKMQNLTVSYVVAFLDMVLKDKPREFERLSKVFLEVVLWAK
ncbi:hypothetical protein E8E13_000186 [Curvularia kusanoi]|uniref:1-alkyl-2-acetylglycerophosphocholine esterase n=1 Tax=Curvularia kusanoi TaxID=90978 RepID=A0A9P4TCH7_CURKU|nr:hypothetical protein E8E13_000186 [Curvularia kusanoi]